jgi:hypothetical protein
LRIHDHSTWNDATLAQLADNSFATEPEVAAISAIDPRLRACDNEFLAQVEKLAPAFAIAQLLWGRALVKIIGLTLAITVGASSHSKAELGIYSALYVYGGCKLAESLPVSPSGTVELADPRAAFCWGAFTVLRGVTTILSDDHTTMALHVCAPTEATVSQYIRIFLRFVDDHPEVAHEDFDFVALMALIRAFPCKPRPSVR